MATQSYPIPKSNPNKQVSITFFLLWLVNAIVIAVANMIFPTQIVLGTMSLSYLAALLLSAGVLAWVGSVTMPIFTEIEMRKQMVLAPQHWLAGYLVINVIAVWIIARISDVIGLGMASWLFVLGFAAVLDFAQGMAMMVYGEMQKKMK